MLNSSVWNKSPGEMSPKMRKFSAEGNAFKKTQVDLKRIHREEKEEQFRLNMHNLLQKKRDASERHSARRLERLIIEQKSN